MNNPIEVIKQFMGRGGPKQFLEQEIMKSIIRENPMIGSLIGMAKKGEDQKVENFAKNLCRERGINYEKEIAKFMNNFSFDSDCNTIYKK